MLVALCRTVPESSCRAFLAHVFIRRVGYPQVWGSLFRLSSVRVYANATNSVFRTSHTDVNINETSSYCDLAPLYGHNQETQDRVRRKEGLGLLHPDSFAEDRLLLLPPAVCVLLVLFSRNHNVGVTVLVLQFVNQLAYSVHCEETLWHKRAEEVQRPFHAFWWRTRCSGWGVVPDRALGELWLVRHRFRFPNALTCCYSDVFRSTVIFSDYVSCILGLVRQGSNWSLDPFRVNFFLACATCSDD